jgi:hypothetical protein
LGGGGGGCRAKNKQTSNTYPNLTNVNTDYNLKSKAILNKESIIAHMMYKPRAINMKGILS